MTSAQRSFSVWYFIGWLLLVYGILILGAGWAGRNSPATAAMAEWHAGIWWGAVLMVIGSVYIWCFRPSRRRQGGGV